MSSDATDGRGRRTGVPPLAHTFNRAPWDPYARPPMTAEQQRFALASQWRLMWWKLRRHRLALISGGVLLVLYVCTLFVEIIAPYEQDTKIIPFVNHPPQAIHFFHEGEFIGPFVYGTRLERNMELMRREFIVDHEDIQPLRFFCSGDEYTFWGLVDWDFHLVCPAEDGRMFLLGTDQLGRDMFSRIVYGARVSLTVGLVGVAISFLLGIFIGGLAGYYGGWLDNLINRVIELFQSFPQLPLWMALSAAVPATWNPIVIFFMITIILGLVDWTGLARAVRSKLLSLREEDFTTAAQLLGAHPRRIVNLHLLPNFMSHLIASATLAIPGMILGETALGYLGLGLQPPVVSWGVLLNSAQDINAVAIHPWLILPVVPVIVTVLAFQFFGDGLRDAADPYK